MARDRCDGRTVTSIRLAWIGPCEATSPLLDRLNSACLSYKIDLLFDRFDTQDWQYSDLALVDRIIIASKSRIDHPWQDIERLQRWPSRSAPWGIVVDLWHAGSRRTGIGPVPYWQLPWYRWWDGWHGWFFPERSRVESLCATAFDAISLPIDLATPPKSIASSSQLPVAMAGHLLIIAACGLTADAWSLSANRAGWSCQVVHPRLFEDSDKSFAAIQLEPDAILWDDSCVDRLPVDSTGQLNFGNESLARNRGSAAIFLATELFPNAPLVTALSVGHVHAWSDFKRLGAEELIVKPSFGLPLTEYLISLGMKTRRS